MNTKKTLIALTLLILSALVISPVVASFQKQDISEADPTIVTEAESAVPANEETQAAAVTASGEAEPAVPAIEAGIVTLSKYGNILLTISPESMEELGFEAADLILVQIGDNKMEMPIGTNYSDVDSGNPICCFKHDSKTGDSHVILAVNAGNMAAQMGVAHIEYVNEDPGYKVVWEEGMDASVSVCLSMSQKQGYAEEYQFHQLGDKRTNNREDYPNLSDAQFANFRSVNTAGMRKDTLYRSSSPVNPAYARNQQADQAMLDACVKTVFNMADSEEKMTSYSDYALTYYCDCDIFAGNMGMDFQNAAFHTQLAEGFRFFASHRGPYLIHCNEGKDRTGFGAAILECLMGASLDEVIADYMITFYNYYGIEEDSLQYDQIWQSNILKHLSIAFGLDPADMDTANLSACAETYLEEIGMTQEEITALKANLSE